MIEKITEYGDSVLNALGYFTTNYGLVELVTDSEQTYPAKYCTNGKYDGVSNFAKKNGSSYWRLLGAPSVASEESQLISSKITLTTVYNMRLVVCIKKDQLPSDNEYTVDSLLNDLVKNLSARTKTLRANLNAKRVEFNPVSFETGNGVVFASEYVAAGQDKMNPKYAYGYIDFNIIVVRNRDCIDDLCTPLSDCDVLLASLSKSDKLECILPTYDFSDTETQDATTAQQQTDLTTWLCGALPPIAYVRPKVAIRNTNFDTYDTGYWLGLGAYDHETTIGLKKILDNNDSSLLASIVGNENEFGNFNRYTNDVGGAVYDGSDGSTSGYMIDHYTGKGWATGVFFNNRNWATSMDYIQNTLAIGAYTGFRAPCIEEYQQITNGNGGQISAPLSSASTIFWMSNSISAANTFICRGNQAIQSSTALFSSFAKTSTSSSIYVRGIRNHYY